MNPELIVGITISFKLVVGMDNLSHKMKGKDVIDKTYPDESCKDAPVFPTLPTPICECGKPCLVTQSMHPSTAARAYYKCGRDWDLCNFFQWIDGPEMVDTRILKFRRPFSRTFDRFNRWVPPPPNPPPMTSEEKKEAVARRMATPPLCNCGDPAELRRGVEDSPYPRIFHCRKRNKHGYPLCDFREYNYGPIPEWPEETPQKQQKAKKRYIIPEKKCDCGVKAKYRLIPSELGIGYYCGHMIGDDLSTRRCLLESYLDSRDVEHEIQWRKKRGIHPEVWRSYVRARTENQRELARQVGLWPRAVSHEPVRMFSRRNEGQNKKSGLDGDVSRRSNNEILRGLVPPRVEGPNEVELETMKSLVSNLPKDFIDTD